MNIELKTTIAFKGISLSYLLLLLLIPGVSAGAIYKWVDEDGKTHYGSERPDSSQAEKLDIKVKEPVIPTKTDDDKKTEKEGFNIDDKNKAKPAEPEEPKMSLKERFQLCNQAKVDLQRIEAKGRIRQQEKDGTSHYLSEKERSQRIAAAKKDIKDYCR